MSTLQISLAVAGGLVLAGVVAHSTWSARKNQPKRATQEVQPEADVTGAAVEPLSERLEPRFESDGFGEASLVALTTMVAIEKKPGLDALIDVIAPVVTDVVVSGEAALAAMPTTRRAGSKPFGVEGLSERLVQRQHLCDLERALDSFEREVRLAGEQHEPADLGGQRSEVGRRCRSVPRGPHIQAARRAWPHRQTSALRPGSTCCARRLPCPRRSSAPAESSCPASR